MHFLCCYANYLTRKQKVPFIMHISILEAKFVRKKCALYTGKYGKLKNLCENVTFRLLTQSTNIHSDIFNRKYDIHGKQVSF